MTDQERIQWLFLEFMKEHARAEKAEEEAAKLRSQFDYIEAKRQARLATNGRINHSRFHNK